MELLSVSLARSIWLFDVNDLNPTGKSIFPDILQWMAEKYSFQSFPKSIADVDQTTKGLIFKTGEFQSDGGAITVNFSFFNDGLVAETWASTEKSDAFLDELLRSAAKKYALVYKPEMIRRKQYISEVVVRVDRSFSDINPKMAQFCEKLNRIFARHHLASFEMTGMSFAPDVAATSYKPPGLVIERKSGAPFTENRFWSKSPFTTKEHLFALKEFEGLLGNEQ